MGSLERVQSAERELQSGSPARAVRELELALASDATSEAARELLLEAHRCCNGLYWTLRGYWRWEGRRIARWVALPMFVALLCAAVGAQCVGGFALLDGLPVLFEPNLIARSAQIAALCGVAAFVVTHEGKSAWVIERVLTTWLVPANVRSRCLDAVALAEHRRATGYALGIAAVVVVVATAVVFTTLTDQRDDLFVGALALGLPFGLALALPASRTRSTVLLVLGLAALASGYEALRAWGLPRTQSSLGALTAWTLLLGFAATPLLIVLHARAARRRPVVPPEPRSPSDRSAVS